MDQFWSPPPFLKHFSSHSGLHLFLELSNFVYLECSSPTISLMTFILLRSVEMLPPRQTTQHKVAPWSLSIMSFCLVFYSTSLPSIFSFPFCCCHPLFPLGCKVLKSEVTLSLSSTLRTMHKI
jgi:hypothetical protein